VERKFSVRFCDDKREWDAVVRRSVRRTSVTHGGGALSATLPFVSGNIRTFYGGGDWVNAGQGFIGFKFNPGPGRNPGDAIKTAQESNNPNDLVQASTFDSLGGLALGRPAWKGAINERWLPQTNRPGRIGLEVCRNPRTKAAAPR